MPRLVNAYTIRPDIQQGDVMLFVVKAVVTRPGRYQLYRCAAADLLVSIMSGGAGDIEHMSQQAIAESMRVPQGSRIANEQAVCEALFPTLARVAEPDV